MNKLFFLLLMITLCSCAPSIQQIKQYEFAKEFKEESLQIPLPNSKEEIQLLRQYGKDKKADLLQKQIIKERKAITGAVKDEFTFTNYSFVELDELDIQKPWLNIKKEELHHDKRDFWLVTLEIIEDGNVKTSSIEESSIVNYKHILRKLNQKLFRLAEKAKP